MKEFGGKLLYRKRKSKRPLAFKNSIHLIMRLKPHLLTFFEPSDQTLRKHIYKIAHKYNIRVYDLIFNHSHMHGVFLFPDRQNYSSFIREISSFLTAYLTKKISFLGVRFKDIFMYRPYTRIVSWGRAYRRLLIYMKKNESESGFEQKSRNETLRLYFRELKQLHTKLKNRTKDSQLYFFGLDPT